MTATSQHGFHPDAESLSAFSEQALSEPERAGVLAHLAVCSRCRQVVALAREAADADSVAAAAPPRRTAETNAWWKQWRFVWVPAAVAVAFAVTTFSFYLEQADRHGPNIRIVAQNPTQGTTPPATPSPTEQAEAVPPASPMVAPPPEHAAKHAHSDATEPMPAPPQPEAPEPTATNQVEASREAPPVTYGAAPQAPPELTAGAMRPAYEQPAVGAWEPGQKQTLQKQAQQEQTDNQRQESTARLRLFRSNTAPAAVHGANQPAPPSASHTDTLDTASLPVPIQTAGLAEPAPTSGIRPSWHATSAAQPMKLPSGLVAVSIASGGHLLLALDKAGALFLSQDHGATWEHIAAQWTGRAITVRRQAQMNNALQTATVTQNGTTGSSSADTGAAPSPAVFFELSNDQNQTWVSTDGRTWTAK